MAGKVCIRARDDDAAVGEAYVGEPDGETVRTGCVTVRVRGVLAVEPTSDNDGIDRFRDRPGIGGGAAYAACSSGVDFLCRSDACRLAAGEGLIVVAIDGSGCLGAPSRRPDAAGTGGGGMDDGGKGD